MAVVAFIGTRYGRQSTSSPEMLTALPNDAEQDEPKRALTTLLGDWVKMIGRMAWAIIPEWILIVLALGAARTWLFPLAGPGLSYGLLALVGLAVAGTLFVIPTAGEVPIVQSLLAYGIAPGLAGSLLLTLPAISLPSMLMTRRAFPAKLLAVTAGTVAVVGIVAGITAQNLF